MNPKTPSITIITTTYNAQNVLPGLISSLRSQDDNDFEWIIVDCASNDGTVELIKSAADIVTKWISEPDFGIYHAINKALDISSGEYYLVAGADDRLFPDALRRYRYHAKLSGADLVSSGITQNGLISFGGRGKAWLNGMFAYISGHSVGSLIRRSLHDRFGYYSRRFPVAADMYFIKSVCMSPDIHLHRADFIAGEHGKTGISSVDKAATFCDCFRVQLETERWKSLQILIFLLKLIWRWRQLVRASSTKSTR